MGGTMSTIRIGVTSQRHEHLPDDMDHDDVVNEIRDVIRKALEPWYAERGHELLRCEPEV